MAAAADVRFKLNTGAEIPALGLGRLMRQYTELVTDLLQEHGNQLPGKSKRP